MHRKTYFCTFVCTQWLKKVVVFLLNATTKVSPFYILLDLKKEMILSTEEPSFTTEDENVV